MNNSYNRTLFSNNNSCFNVTTLNNITNYTAASDEGSRILSWISPLESLKRHHDVARARAEGVGEWVLQSREFQAWRGNDRSVGRILVCHGAPGAGKTFICSLVIDRLCDTTTKPNAAVGCIYCDYRGQKEQTVEVMIGSLLRQFLAGLDEIPQAIIQAFYEARAHLGGRVLKLAKLVELLSAVLERFQQVFICVDALDEFVPEYRARLLRSLRQIVDTSPNARLFLTLRPYIQDLESNIPLDMGIITIQPRFSDIQTYLVTRLDADPHPAAMDNELRSEIMTRIPRESPEISFLLVKLHIDSILGEITIGGRRRELCEMTTGLSDTYTATLERIKGQHGALARYGISALMWISLAERPLLIDELCHALATKVGSPNIITEMVPQIKTVVASCMGLVTTDDASSTVRLVHATLEVYLRRHKDNVFQNPHATIAEICLNYLRIRSVRELPSNLKTAPAGFPLLDYASCHWGAHARKQLTVRAKHLALKLLDRYSHHAAANIFSSNRGALCHWRSSSAGFSGLHYVAYFGIDELLEALLGMGPRDLNQTDEWGRTPLILAAENGNEGVVKILILRTDVNPNSMGWYGKTPLSQASTNGHKGVVRALLSRADVNPNTPDACGQTPLLRASARGHEGVVKTLLSRPDVNPNSADQDGQTPLLGACAGGYEGVVRILLSRPDVNLNTPHRTGITPLLLASANGHKGVVRILLSCSDFNCNSADLDGQTPLFKACENGHEGVVGVLLGRIDVKPNLADKAHETPLLRASANGHERVVRILLSRLDVNPGSADRNGQTPLLQASSKGHGGVVRILLNSADVNPNSADQYDRTPLFLASANGHKDVAGILLSRPDVNPNLVDRYGQTPLFRASSNGYEGVVRVLLSRTDVNPNAVDRNGQAPLHKASAKGYEGVVRILLNRADVNPNSADQYGRTPLFLASANGYKDVTGILLSRADVNPNLVDGYGQTPLFRASSNGYGGVVRALLSRADVNPMAADRNGQTPLHKASAKGYEGVVKMLLSHAYVNPNLPNWYEQTPLFLALANGHEGVARILLSRTNVNPNSLDWYHRTPLF